MFRVGRGRFKKKEGKIERSIKGNVSHLKGGISKVNNSLDSKER